MSNNPAGRLRELFREAWTRDGSKEIWAVWAEVLGLKGDLSLLLREISYVYELPSLIRREINSLGLGDAEKEACTRYLPAIERAMFDLQIQRNTFSQFTDVVTEPALYGLEVADLVLRSTPEPDLGDQAIEDLLSEVRALIAEVIADTTISPDLRSFMLDHLYAIERALAEVRVRGAAAVQEVLTRAMGAEVANSAAGAPTAGEPGATRFWDFVAKAGLVVGLLSSALGLPGKIADASKTMEHVLRTRPALEAPGPLPDRPAREISAGEPRSAEVIDGAN